MSAQPFSRADRNRVKRGRRHERPVNVKAVGRWAGNVLRRENPGAKYHDAGALLRLVYPERSAHIAIGKIRRHPLMRLIDRPAPTGPAFSDPPSRLVTDGCRIVGGLPVWIFPEAP